MESAPAIKYPYEILYRDGKKAFISEPPKDLSDPNLTQNAEVLLSRRYAHKRADDKGEIIAVESPKQIYWRVADFVSYGSLPWLNTETARRDLAKQYYLMMVLGDFLPNTPTLINAGREDFAQLAACFVLPIEDSMESIFRTLTNEALIHKTGGGTGFSFSQIRPEFSLVRDRGIASGPISFMRMYNKATEVIKQGGVRRGANMGILEVHHPDIEKFITCKSTDDEAKIINNFNISVAISDAFMNAKTEGTEYDLIDPHLKRVVGKRFARQIWEMIVKEAWEWGDPGLFFIDRANQSLANPIIGWFIRSTNPCGEQPIYDNDACNLGSINLLNFLRLDMPLNAAWRDKIDWPKFARCIHLAIRFLDDVISVSTYPLAEIIKMADSIRRIGLGPMGLADLLQWLWIPYESDQALEVSKVIGEFFHAEAVKASQKLAKERGTFPLFKESVFVGNEPERRNANVTTCAPTGTLCRLVNVEGGIEPTTLFKYRHETQNLWFTNDTVKNVLSARGLWNPEIEEVINETGYVTKAKSLSDEAKEVFKTGLEIDPEHHVKMQAVWQTYFSESGVSKTINLRPEATIEDVDNAYNLAYNLGCMGITVFRYGCKREPMMAEVKRKGLPEKIVKKERPFEMRGSTYKIKTPHGNAYFTINIDNDNDFFESFITIGKSGNEMLELVEGSARLLSLIGRMPMAWSIEERLEEVVKQFRGIGGKKALGQDDENLVRSLMDGIAYCCDYFLKNNLRKQSDDDPATKKVSGLICPECHNMMYILEGCRGGKCLNCCYSAC